MYFWMLLLTHALHKRYRSTVCTQKATFLLSFYIAADVWLMMYFWFLLAGVAVVAAAGIWLMMDFGILVAGCSCCFWLRGGTQRRGGFAAFLFLFLIFLCCFSFLLYATALFIFFLLSQHHHPWCLSRHVWFNSATTTATTATTAATATKEK